MTTSLNGDFNLVKLLFQDKSTYRELKILNTTIIDNETLAMMSARYKKLEDRNPLYISKDITDELKDDSDWTKFNNRELSVIYQASALQLVKLESKEYFAFCSSVGSSKVFILDVIQPTIETQNRVMYVQFIDELNQIEYTIDLFNNKASAYTVNFLVMLFQGLDKLSNYSPYLHNFMQFPHSDTLDLTFLKSSLNEVYDSKLLDGFFNNQSQTVIAEESSLFDDNYIGNYKAHSIGFVDGSDNYKSVNFDGMYYGRRYYR